MTRTHHWMADCAGWLLGIALATAIIAWPLAIWKLCELLELVYWWLIQPMGL